MKEHRKSEDSPNKNSTSSDKENNPVYSFLRSVPNMVNRPTIHETMITHRHPILQQVHSTPSNDGYETPPSVSPPLPYTLSLMAGQENPVYSSPRTPGQTVWEQMHLELMQQRENPMDSPVYSSASVHSSTKEASLSGSTPRLERVCECPYHNYPSDGSIPITSESKAQCITTDSSSIKERRTPMPILMKEDDVESVSTASSYTYTLQNIESHNIEMLGVARETLAHITEFPKAQAEVKHSIQEVKEQVSRLKRRANNLELAVERVVYSSDDINHKVDTIMDMSRRPQKIDALSVTSTTIWLNNALHAARSIIDVCHDDSHVVAQYIKIGQYARLHRYGYYNPVEYSRSIEHIRDQLDHYSNDLPEGVEARTQTVNWDEHHCRSYVYSYRRNECQCIPEMTEENDEHEDPMMCAARRYAQNLLLEIRLQLHHHPLSCIQLVKVENIIPF